MDALQKKELSSRLVSYGSKYFINANYSNTDGEGHFVQISNWRSPELSTYIDVLKMKHALASGYRIIRVHNVSWNNRSITEEDLLQAIDKNEGVIFLIGQEMIELYENHKQLMTEFSHNI